MYGGYHCTCDQQLCQSAPAQSKRKKIHSKMEINQFHRHLAISWLLNLYRVVSREAACGILVFDTQMRRIPWSETCCDQQEYPAPRRGLGSGLARAWHRYIMLDPALAPCRRGRPAISCDTNSVAAITCSLYLLFACYLHAIL
jgi:hypothetical protein